MTITTMKKRSKHMGRHFFDADSMRFFGSVIESEPTDDGIFITSEKDSMGIVWDGKRRYTIRKFDWETGEVDDVSEFGQYTTLNEAKEAMV